MNKTLIALFCALPLAASAADTDWKHDMSVTAGGVSVGYDQDGGETTVGVGGISLRNSDTVDVGITYATSLMGGLSGSLTLDHHADDDNVVGIDTAMDMWGMSFAPSVDWNVTDSQFDGEMKVSYGIAGVDASSTFKFDINETDYTGADLSFGYSWSIAENVAVVPNITVPFDTDWERGDATAGVSVNISF